MKRPPARVVAVAVLAVSALYPALVTRMPAPANYGGHELTQGFGRGRLDLPGIVSDGSAARIELPSEPLSLAVRLSGDGEVRLLGEGSAATVLATDVPATARLELPRGGPVAVQSPARVRLYEMTLERKAADRKAALVLLMTGLAAMALATRGLGGALVGALAVLLMLAAVARGSLTATFASLALAQIAPLVTVLLLLTPLGLAIRRARFPKLSGSTRLSRIAFGASLALSLTQLALFDQPRIIGDSAAYFDMAGRFAASLGHLASPLALGPALSELQPYLALPATGLLYGLLRLPAEGPAFIYPVQALFMALAVGALVALCEAEIGARAAWIALAIALAHPSFSILPGIVQPEPFILAAWTLAALITVRTLREGPDPRRLLGAGVLFGIGLCLHPQGLSFLLVALALCLVPWARELVRRPAILLVPLLGIASVTLPAAAAEHFSKPRAHILDRQYGFFAYTSPHPLGFWLYTDSDGWQGPLRIEDTTYQKELIAMKGPDATASGFADAAAFAARHPAESAGVVLRNLHRLWNRPDNPFAVPFPLPWALHVPLHRALVVLFLVGLPILLGGRLALVVVPFVMLSMTYPAYHVFNKYATPALTFTVIGAALVLDRLWSERSRSRALLMALGLAAVAALLPTTTFARLGIPGDAFLLVARGLLWLGLALAIAAAVRQWGVDGRSRLLGGLIAAFVLLVSSYAASRTDVERGAWSVALDRPFEASCRVPAEAASSSSSGWLYVDAESRDGVPPRIEVSGRVLDGVAPTMPTFGLATYRGRRDPATFRQYWRARLPDDLLAPGELRIRLSGSGATRVFGDIRGGNDGPRLSLGAWPYLSVYRLMHEGEYRLPVFNAPAQACVAAGISGRPGLSLVRIAAGEEDLVATRNASPPAWLF